MSAVINVLQAGEKGRGVKIPRGPAAVREEFLQECHQNMGRQEVMLTLEPEDLPVMQNSARDRKRFYLRASIKKLVIFIMKITSFF